MSSGAMVMGVVRVTVYLLKTICMFGYALGCEGCGEGEANASAASYTGAGEWERRPAALASPASVGLPFLEHSNESLYPRGLADPDVMRWGWGLRPSSGLAASDKKPWEEFTAPFNTVIIFSAFSGRGLLLPGMPVSLPSGRCQGWQVHRITSEANPKLGRALGKEEEWAE